jgi:hypothetical protein
VLSLYAPFIARFFIIGMQDVPWRPFGVGMFAHDFPSGGFASAHLSMK